MPAKHIVGAITLRLSGQCPMLTYAQLQSMDADDPDAHLLERFSWLCRETTPKPPTIPVWEWPAAISAGTLEANDDLFAARFEILVFGDKIHTDISLNEIARAFDCDPLQAAQFYVICHRLGALRWNRQDLVIEELRSHQDYIPIATHEFRQYLAESSTHLHEKINQ